MLFKYQDKKIIEMCIEGYMLCGKPFQIILLASLAIFMALGTSGATTYLVSEQTKDFSIQNAINTAKSGDRIIVKSGIYSERINVTKDLILIGVNTGKGNPVINADNKRSAITLYSDDVWLEGFKIINSGSNQEDAGIKVFSNHNLIKGNILSNNSYGIYLKSSKENRIEDNLATGNDVGIALQSSNSSIVRDNCASDNSFAGFFIGNSRDNKIFNNTAKENAWVGFLLNESINNSIERNVVQNNTTDGIWILNSRNNTINENSAKDCSLYGIFLDSAHNNTISKNNVSGNLDGISLDSSTGNIVKENNISYNMFGIYVDNSMYNRIYLNDFVANHENAYSYDSFDWWYSEKALGYLYNGKISWNFMGNFWSDHDGYDWDGSGMVNKKYRENNITDNRPLISKVKGYKLLI